MRHLHRAERSLLFGAVVSIVLVMWADTSAHARVAAAAAQNHTTVSGFLVTGAIGVAVATGAVAFVVGSLSHRRRPQRSRPGPRR